MQFDNLSMRNAKHFRFIFEYFRDISIQLVLELIIQLIKKDKTENNLEDLV